MLAKAAVLPMNFEAGRAALPTSNFARSTTPIVAAADLVAGDSAAGVDAAMPTPPV